MTRHRPYDRAADEDVAALERFRGRAHAFADACRELGWHIGVAIGRGPVECPTCGTPWPCAHEKAR
jgi:hypothetical protein